MTDTPACTLQFERGTLLVEAPTDELRDALANPPLPGCVFDERVGAWRAPGRFYRDVVLTLKGRDVPFADRAKAFEVLPLSSRIQREPFPYQSEAVEAWWEKGRRGVVVLPTGAGKTFVAHMIMERVERPALVVTPTLDLMQQWYGGLKTAFGHEIGLLGGGYHEPQPITVTTYDSAYLHMERLGNQYGLVVFDECHHLPGPSYQHAADCMVAPFRLGLSATPERQDGGEHLLRELIGPVVYRREIKELAGDYLSEYETVRLRVVLSDEDREEYHEERAIYRDFVSRSGIRLSEHGGWARFLAASSRSEEGRRAFLAYRRQKTIAQASDAKLAALEDLLDQHRGDRILIFTSDNNTVYRIARRYLIPAITHQTKVKERQELLERFATGDFPCLVTSKVLNEGVDVPAANVGVVLSGSGSVREHVQRLGRILRRAENKRATLYEVIAEDTAEEFVSQRRRKHSAYR